MFRDIVGVTIVVVVWICCLILVFAPTIYAGWLYFMSRRLPMKSKGVSRLFLLTLCINLMAAYFLLHLGMDYFLPAAVAEKDDIAVGTLRNAVNSQEKFRVAHGRYYPVGPIRGPYRDEHGLVVDEDVVLEVVPVVEETGGRESFKAYAAHVWGRSLAVSANDGKIEKTPAESGESGRIRKRLLNSIR